MECKAIAEASRTTRTTTLGIVAWWAAFDVRAKGFPEIGFSQ